MSLVQIARFADLTEAHVAASALVASGISATVFDELGQTYYLLQTALGGFRLMVSEADADEARAYITSLRQAPREPIERKRSTKNALAFVLGLLIQ
ncbi:putative signal transducing protein [Phenylobacterium sp.]|jgi:hypothetical protein|uniref:putative signal transducing protein n=1 Tax=Phenylobacterium sp. TaxID=1871053 RepID=UPI0037C614F7